MSGGDVGLWLVFSTLSVVTTVKEKTIPSATKSSIVRITQTYEIVALSSQQPEEKEKGGETQTQTCSL